MLFNSIEFFVFFAAVYALYRLLPFRGQNWLLLVAGYVFYGAWDVRFLFLIAFSTTVDFATGLMLADGRISVRQRVTASAFLIGTALLFLCVNWAAVAVGLAPPSLAIDWPRLFDTGSRTGLATLIGTAVIVAGANLLYPVVLRLGPTPQKRLLVFLSVVVNLSFLGFFKYFNFFIGSAEAGLAWLGFNPEVFRLNVILPVGISFYTFQSLSYTLDAYRGQVQPARRFWDFALFVAYFPPMVAGPIERAKHLLPQLLQPRTIRLDQSFHGVVLILLGLFKKVAIADGVAPAVDAVYNSTGAVGAADIVVATVLFAVQIYCDFSGYSDIAIGVSKMLGIDLMYNFNLPYFSRNPSEFWRRWHISLSSWLRDYLYIPLGGNRKGEGRTYVNLMTTMVLGGLWHGAAWNYVLWGFYQGALLCGHRLCVGEKAKEKRPLPTSGEAIANTAIPPEPRGLPWHWLTTPLAIAFFFVFVCYGWMLFRANSLEQIVTFTKSLVGFGPSGVASVLPRPVLPALLGIPLLFALHLIEYNGNARGTRVDVYRWWPRPLQGALYAAMILILVMGTSNAPVQFIYFQF